MLTGFYEQPTCSVGCKYTQPASLEWIYFVDLLIWSASSSFCFETREIMFPKIDTLFSRDVDDFILENSLEILDDRFLIVEILIRNSFFLNDCRGVLKTH